MQWIVLNTGDFKKFVPWLNQKWRVTSRKIKFCTVPFFWLWCNHLDLIHSTHSCSQENIRRFGNVIFFSNTNYITSFLEKRSNGEWRSRTRIVEGIDCKTQGSVSWRFEFSIWTYERCSSRKCLNCVMNCIQTPSSLLPSWKSNTIYSKTPCSKSLIIY